MCVPLWAGGAQRCPLTLPLVLHRDPFVLAKMQREDGLFLIHWSTSHFNRLILTVAQQDQVGLGRGFWAGLGCTPCLDPCSPPSSCHPPQAPGTQCLRLWKFPIELCEGTFRLQSWDRSFPSVRELRAALQGCALRAGDHCFSLRHCCLPQPGGKMTGAHRVGGQLPDASSQ